MTKTERKTINKLLGELDKQLRYLSETGSELHMTSELLTSVGKKLLEEQDEANEAVEIAAAIKRRVDAFESEVLIQQTNLLTLEEKLLPGTRARREREAEYQRQEQLTATMERYAGYSGT